MITAVGNGKPKSSKGWAAAAGTQVGSGVKIGIKSVWGATDSFLIEHLVCMRPEQRLLQVKRERKML